MPKANKKKAAKKKEIKPKEKRISKNMEYNLDDPTHVRKKA